MADHIDGYDLQRRADLIEAREAREQCFGYDRLIAEAAARGYRRATLYEQETLSPADLYTYRNEVFVKDASAGVALPDGGQR